MEFYRYAKIFVLKEFYMVCSKKSVSSESDLRASILSTNSVKSGSSIKVIIPSNVIDYLQTSIFVASSVVNYSRVSVALISLITTP